MSLTDVSPEGQTLSRREKIRLIQLLAQDLERDEEELIESGRSYPGWSPDRAFYGRGCAPTGVRGRERPTMTALAQGFPCIARDPSLGNAFVINKLTRQRHLQRGSS